MIRGGAGSRRGGAAIDREPHLAKADPVDGVSARDGTRTITTNRAQSPEVRMIPHPSIHSLPNTPSIYPIPGITRRSRAPIIVVTT